MSALTVFFASLLGSAHCAGMCGGFAACMAGNSGSSWFPQVTYNSGRLLTYVLLGALAGWLGSSINNAAALVGVQQAAAVLTGVLLVYWGVRGLFASRISGLSSGWIYSKVRRLFGSLITPDNRRSANLRAFLLGTLSTLLPCGWLYAFVALAAATGSAIGGSLLMACFWLGSVPALVAVATATRLLSERLRRWTPRLTAAMLLAAGIFSLTGHVLSPLDSAESTCPHHPAVNPIAGSK